MKIRLSLVIAVLLLFVVVWAVSVISGYAATNERRGDEMARARVRQSMRAVAHAQKRNALSCQEAQR